ncbi:MAG: alanine racemase [Solirubrobacterales bacterium]
MPERALARIDLGAVERNCALLASRLTNGARLCAVVKADGYGHGADACAEAALRGGAGWLAVATAREAEQIGRRLHHIRLLTMGALTASEVDVALGAGSEIGVSSEGFRALLAARARAQGRPALVHVKHDSGMGRLGNRDPGEVLRLARVCAADPDLELAGVWTHFATADETGNDFNDFFEEQLERFDALAGAVRAEFGGVMLHAANSAATLRQHRSHFDMVRCGVAIYGLDPFQDDPRERGLVPAMELHSYVADVKRFRAGDSAGYGRTWAAAADTWVGVLPIGYGDGVRRGLSNNADVLVGGRRRPVVGTISMANLTIDLGPETDVAPGAPAVLIGAQGAEEILAEELAGRLGTINYESACGVSPRVRRELR